MALAASANDHVPEERLVLAEEYPDTRERPSHEHDETADEPTRGPGEGRPPDGQKNDAASTTMPSISGSK